MSNYSEYLYFGSSRVFFKKDDIKKELEYLCPSVEKMFYQNLYKNGKTDYYHACVSVMEKYPATEEIMMNIIFIAKSLNL